MLAPHRRGRGLVVPAPRYKLGLFIFREHNISLGDRFYWFDQDDHITEGTISSRRQTATASRGSSAPRNVLQLKQFLKTPQRVCCTDGAEVRIIQKPGFRHRRGAGMGLPCQNLATPRNIEGCTSRAARCDLSMNCSPAINVESVMKARRRALVSYSHHAEVAAARECPRTRRPNLGYRKTLGEADLASSVLAPAPRDFRQAVSAPFSVLALCAVGSCSCHVPPRDIQQRRKSEGSGSAIEKVALP